VFNGLDDPLAEGLLRVGRQRPCDGDVHPGKRGLLQPFPSSG
jgi:hypothetical protein